MSLSVEDESMREAPLPALIAGLLDSGYMADCTLVLTNSQGQDVRFPVHRALLGQVSPRFQDLFTRPSKKFRLTHMSAETFNLMLMYIYKAEVILEDPESALALIYAAHQHSMRDLMKICAHYLSKRVETMPVECLSQTFDVAVTRRLVKLRDKTTQCVASRTSSVLKSEAFLEWRTATLLHILEQDRLAVCSEVQLVDACLDWAVHRRKAKLAARSARREKQKEEAEKHKEGNKEENSKVKKEKKKKKKRAPPTLREVLGNRITFALRLRSMSDDQLRSLTGAYPRDHHPLRKGLVRQEEESTLPCSVRRRKGELPSLPEGFSKGIRIFMKKPLGADHSRCTYCAENLVIAVEEGDLDKARELIDNKVPVDGENHWGLSALLTAVWTGSHEMVNMLLVRGADPNQVEPKKSFTGSKFKGSSALHQAIFYNFRRVAETLLYHGSNVNVVDSAGDSPLLWAVRKGNLDMVKTLLKAGACPTTANKVKETPLLLSIDVSDERMVRVLLESNVDPNSSVDPHAPKDSNSSEPEVDTPLARAIKCCQLNVIRLVLEANADPTRACNGQLPLDLATAVTNEYLLDGTIIKILEASILAWNQPSNPT